MNAGRIETDRPLQHQADTHSQGAIRHPLKYNRTLLTNQLMQGQGDLMPGSEPATSVVNVEVLIASESAAIAAEMSHIAASAQSEEDVRHECNKLIDSFIKKAGLKIKGRHEYEIGGGFLDSKYSGVLLEYKYPKGPGRIGTTSDNPGSKKVIEQLQTRFEAFHLKEHQPFEKLLGIGLDSIRVIFLRRHGAEWELEEPQPITKYNVERILRALVSLGAQGFSFTPTQLAAHFGSGSTLAQGGIRKLYSVHLSTTSKKTKMFFQEWKILFGEVCGYDLGKTNEKLRSSPTTTLFWMQNLLSCCSQSTRFMLSS